MRRTRFLLVTTALSSAAVASACRKEALPGNPKGSAYDAGEVVLAANPKGSQYDDGLQPAPDAATATPPPTTTTTVAPHDAGRAVLPMPANPKGSHYDAGIRRK